MKFLISVCITCLIVISGYGWPGSEEFPPTMEDIFKIAETYDVNGWTLASVTSAESSFGIKLGETPTLAYFKERWDHYYTEYYDDEYYDPKVCHSKDCLARKEELEGLIKLHRANYRSLKRIAKALQDENPNALAAEDYVGSHLGAIGPLQIQPHTFWMWMETWPHDANRFPDPLNPYDALATAAHILAWNTGDNKSLQLGIRDYNGGGMAYVNNVRKHLHILLKRYPEITKEHGKPEAF